jgi:DNA polymerase-1
MLVNADIKGLEVVVAADLSGDKVLKQEIVDKVDIHETNRDRFGLGEGKPGRLVAKVFKFRLIYGGSAYSYAHDSDFTGVSTSEKFWQRIIDEYYDKYKGIKEWHRKLIQTAIAERQLEIPSGRIFPIEQNPNGRWPETIIKNYPVQGFGADLVMLARLQARKLLMESGLEAMLVSTIHDSIVADCPEKNVVDVGHLLNQAVEDVPRLCRLTFGYDFSLPMTAEVQYGPNKKDLRDLTIS